MEQLPLYVYQKAGGSNPKHVVVQPGVPQLLLDQDEPGGGILGSPAIKLLIF